MSDAVVPRYKQIKVTIIGHEEVDVKISTICLGFDHNHSDSGPPILYETMAMFNGKNVLPEEIEEYTARHSREDDALEWHNDVVKQIYEKISGATCLLYTSPSPRDS